jgi:acetylglutamate kinase
MAKTQTTSSSIRSDWLAKAEVLTEALPFMRQYSGHHIVVKFGGHAMTETQSIQSFANDMVLLNQVGACPMVVHGGGPQIGTMLSKLNIQSEFINGLRVTDSDTVNIVEMVLCGAINKTLVGALQQAGGSAVGISGKDSGLITAAKITATKDGHTIDSTVDLGFVGEPTHIDTRLLYALIDAGITPIIAPIAPGADGATYNINADTAAGAISTAMNATRLLMLTDVSGVLSKTGEHIQKLNIKQAEALIADGTITGGMIPKVETCIDAVKNGTKAAVILDGRERHAVLVELFTEHGIGTIITND